MWLEADNFLLVFLLKILMLVFLTFGQALVVARLVPDVPPMNIRCDGVIVPGSAWERYNFAHPGASVSDFLYADGLSNDV
jgi:hypothetical protein